MKQILVALTIALTPDEYQRVKDFEIKANDTAGREITGYWLLKSDTDFADGIAARVREVGA